ncbi:MAG: Tfp pilus assembly protein FimT/FimU [Vicinamibacterales bacterium]
MTRRTRPAVGARGRLRPDADHGVTLIESLIALTLIFVVIAFAVPTTAATVDAGRVGHAAGVMAGRFRLARQEAVAGSRSVGLVFDRVSGRWTFRVCVDGNGNGIRRSEIASGTDRCPEGPIDLEAMLPGIRIDVDPTLRGPGGEPPSPDAVRFGASDLASFSPLGSCTAGTLFLRSPLGAQFAVRIGGATGRTRVLRYDHASRVWQEV